MLCLRGLLHMVTRLQIYHVCNRDTLTSLLNESSQVGVGPCFTNDACDLYEHHKHAETLGPDSHMAGDYGQIQDGTGLFLALSPKYLGPGCSSSPLHFFYLTYPFASFLLARPNTYP